MTAVAARSFTPREPREASQCLARIFGPTIADFTSRVHNISRSGMLLDHGGQLSIGDVIFAELPGLGNVLGEIVRLKESAAGVKFSAPINLGLYRQALNTGSSSMIAR